MGNPIEQAEDIQFSDSLKQINIIDTPLAGKRTFESGTIERVLIFPHDLCFSYLNFLFESGKISAQDYYKGLIEISIPRFENAALRDWSICAAAYGEISEFSDDFLL